MNRTTLFLLGSLLLLLTSSGAHAQGCATTLTPHFSVYSSITRDGKNIYTAVSMQGYADVAPSAGCPMYSATHKVGAQNVLGGTGGWKYSASGCPTCYFSVTNNEQIVGVPGVVYPYNFEGESICSLAGPFWGSNGSASITGCVVPSKETTAAVGRSNITSTIFSQVISDTAGDSFDGEEVQEGDAAAGQDTCWFDTSKFLPLNGITGGNWTVAGGQVAGEHNTWGWDGVGYIPQAVTYYRDEAPAHGKHIPCGATGHQSMQIMCNANTWWVYTPTSGNLLTATINQTTVTNCRDDISGTDCDVINY